MRLTEIEPGSQLYKFADDYGHGGQCAIWADRQENGVSRIVFGARSASGSQPALWLDQLVPLASSLLLDGAKEVEVFIIYLRAPGSHPVWRFPHLAKGDDAGVPVDSELARQDFAGFVPEEVLRNWDWGL
jgi:hypothetical protein